MDIFTSIGKAFFKLLPGKCRVTTLLSAGIFILSQQSLSAQSVTTIAGKGTAGISGDGGPAVDAQLYGPTDAVTDKDGNIYVAEINNNRIRKIDVNGNISTFAGNGLNGFQGEGGPAANARLYRPYSLAISGGNLYVADQNNNAIRKINLSTTIITTVVGKSTAGFSGDGGLATAALLNKPTGIAVDAAGNMFIADNVNNRIRKVDVNGIITTIAGDGGAGFSGDGGPATSSRLKNPNGVAVDGSGNVYIADRGNHRIRKISTDGKITTVAGNGMQGSGTDGDPALSTRFDYPFDVTVDFFGNVMIADWGGSRIRKLDIQTNTVKTVVDLTSVPVMPTGIGIDELGNIFIPDQLGNKLYKAEQALPSTLAAPVLLSAVPGNGRIDLTWKAVYGATEYNIYRGTVSGSLALLPGMPVKNTVFQDKTSSNGTRYYYAVTAVNKNCESVKSTELGAIPVLPQPSNLTASIMSYQVSLGWNNVEGVTAYKVYRGSSSGSLTALPGMVYSTNFTDNTVVSGDAFYYAVKAVDDHSESNLSSGVFIMVPQPPSALITTVAGNGIITSATAPVNGTLATNVILQGPTGVRFDSKGNLYIAHGEVFVDRVNVSNGTIFHVAGMGSGPYINYYDNGPAIRAGIRPVGIAIDRSDNLYIAHTGESRILKVNTGTGVISTVAGTGNNRYSEDGNTALYTDFGMVDQIEVDEKGNLYISEFYGRVRRIDAITKIVSTVARNADNASGFLKIALDKDGNLYYTDVTAFRIFKRDAVSGNVTLVAGNGSKVRSGDNSLAINAGLGEIRCITVDKDNNIYLAGMDQQIRKISAAGVITTIAGSGVAGYSGDNGLAIDAQLNFPASIAVNSDGDIFIADNQNGRIRKLGSPYIKNVRLVSGNAESGKARSGDVVTLTFEAVKSLSQLPSVIISGQQVSVSLSGGVYKASCTLSSSTADGIVPFSISNLKDNSGADGGTVGTSITAVIFDKTPPKLEQVRMVSKGSSNPARVGKDNEVVLSFVALETLPAAPAITIGGHEVAVVQKGGAYEATYKLQESDPEGIIPFTISNYRDLVGNEGTEVTSASASVFYDKTPAATKFLSFRMVNRNTTERYPKGKEGDQVILAFETEETLANIPEMSVNGHKLIPVYRDNYYETSYILTASDPEGPVTFSIKNIRDIAGNVAKDLNQVDFNGNALIYDKTAPELKNVKVQFSNSRLEQLKAEDKVTISFDVSESISTVPKLILSGHDLAVSRAGDHYTAVYSLNQQDLPVTFLELSVNNIIDSAGNAGLPLNLKNPFDFALNLSPATDEKLKEGQAVGAFAANTGWEGNYMVVSPASGEDASVYAVVPVTGQTLNETYFELATGAGDTDNSAFDIGGKGLVPNELFNYPSKASFSIRVRAINSNNLPREKTFTFAVRDIFKLPEDIRLSNSSIAENSARGSVIGAFRAIDQDPDHNYSYVLQPGDGSDDNMYFRISGNELISEESFDYETKSAYRIRVRATNQKGLVFEKRFDIEVIDVPEAPTGIILNKTSIRENVRIGSLVGYLYTEDVQQVQKFTYDLVSGEGDVDNHCFAINDDELITQSEIDYELKSVYHIRIRTTNSYGLSYEKVFQINAEDVDSQLPLNLRADGGNWKVDWEIPASSKGDRYLVQYEIRDESGKVVVPEKKAGFLSTVGAGAGFYVIMNAGKATLVEVGAGTAASAFGVVLLPVGLVAGSIVWMIYNESLVREFVPGDVWDDGSFNQHFSTIVNDYLIGRANTPVNQPENPEKDKDPIKTRIATARSVSAWADIDNDGDLDLTVMTPDKTKDFKKGQAKFPRRLDMYLNINSLDMGNMGMVPYPVQYPALPEIADGSITWLHANNDEYLDLFITGSDTSGVLYSKLYYQYRVTKENVGFIYSKVAELTGGTEQIDSTKLNIPEFSAPMFFDPASIQNAPADALARFAGIPPLTEIPGLFRSSSAAGDMNNDGLQDLVVTGMKADRSAYFGIFLQQKGGGFKLLNTKIPGVIDGSVSLVDYDRSGRLSILLTGANNIAKVCRQKVDGTFEIIDLPVSTSGRSKWWDYNNDGYMDIIIGGNPSKILLNEAKNDGQERVFTDVTAKVAPAGLPKIDESAVETADLNNDGKPDFVVSGTPAEGIGHVVKVYYQDGSGDKITFTEDNSTGIRPVSNGSINFIYDNNFTPQLFVTGSAVPYTEVAARALTKGIIVTEEPLSRYPFAGMDVYDVKKGANKISPNTHPVSPVWLTATVNNNDNSVTLSWQESYDKETPSKGLSYNVYVSTEPGEEMFTSADHNSDSYLASVFTGNSGDVLNPLSSFLYGGTRNLVQVGNTVKNSITIKGLARDKAYYWGVQTIDNGYLASEFSAERRFYMGPPVELFPNDRSLSVHPVLTPNGDGINDELQIRGLEYHAVSQVKIMNTSGNMVWSSFGYNSSTGAFKGLDSANKKLLPGTYYYQVKYDDGKWLTGYLVLLD